MSETATKSEDVALVLGASENAEHIAILRKREQQIEAAILSRAEEGKPIHGDLVRLRPRDESALCDVETLYEAPTKGASKRGTSAGPAQVATDRYRQGWDRLFSKRHKPS